MGYYRRAARGDENAAGVELLSSDFMKRAKLGMELKYSPTRFHTEAQIYENI
jgi:hypothetical protein